MSAVARTLDVARSHFNERRGRTVKPRGPYRKAEDVKFLVPIRAFTALEGDAAGLKALADDIRGAG